MPVVEYAAGVSDTVELNENELPPVLTVRVVERVSVEAIAVDDSDDPKLGRAEETGAELPEMIECLLI